MSPPRPLPAPILSWSGVLLLLACSAVATPPAAAQSRGTSALRGTVVSADGTRRAGAQVQLVQAETGLERAALTNANGEFLFLLLPPGGPYTLTARTLGFAEERREDVRLRVGEIEVIQLVLQEEALAIEGLDVDVSRADVFNPSRVGPATLLDERVVESLPILSRDLMQMAVLSPLVTTTDGGGFSVAGQNDRYNAVLVDGILGKDMFGLTAAGVPGGQAGAKLIPIDAVSQYEILVAPFDVRLSGFTGGVMNAVTKTGTNRWQLRASGVHRSEALMGDLRLPTGSAEASGVDRSLIALSLGGPIVRNQAHFFVAGEFERRRQPPIGYNVGRDDPFLPRLTLESAREARDLFETRFGLDPGEPGAYPLAQSLSNLFVRVDWRLSERHRITFRDIFASANNDESPNRLGSQPYGFASNAVRRDGRSHLLSAQLLSTFGEAVSNELTFQAQRSRDESRTRVDWPQFRVQLLSVDDGTSLAREVRFGANSLAQDAGLAQTQARITNALTVVRGTSTYTLGVTGSIYRISHRYLPGALGEWVFGGIQDIEANDPTSMQFSTLAEGEKDRVEFDVLEWGGFVQNEMSVGRGLTMRFGLRVDVPHTLDAPDTNFAVLDFFGFDTGSLPSGNVLISPRWGFNWQRDGQRRTQVRGGLGLFTGQLPFVWLSNAFHDNGLRSATYLCEGRPSQGGGLAPPFDPSSPALGCVRGEAPDTLRNVTVFHPAFKYPQDLKFSIVVDRELSERLSGSIGVLFNKAINQIVLEELNLGDPAPDQGPLRGLGGSEGRRFFGRPAGPEPPVVLANVRNPGFNRVLLATNESEDLAFAVTLEARGRLSERLGFQAGYTFSRAFDKMSLVSADLVSNYGLNPVDVDPNRPALRTSNFDRPHKVVFSLHGAPFPGLDRTELAVLYTGQSGYPFSFVYGFDLNGDGYPGPGAAYERTNDLVYAPMDSDEVPVTIATAGLLGRAISSFSCLEENRGRILRRNACRAPWQNRLDLRLTQGLDLGSTRIRLEADLINVLNLLDSDWGHITTVRPATPLLDGVTRPGQCATPVCAPLLRWSGASFRGEDGAVLPAAPWYSVTPDSQWQLQIGARVGLGGPGR